MAAGVRLRDSGPILAAIGLHVVALALLTWRLGVEPRLAATPVVSVELVPRRPETRPRVASPPRRRLPPITLRRPAPDPAVPPLVAPAQPAAPTQSDAENAVRPILRGLLGCQHADLAALTPEERGRCLEQYGQAGAAPERRLNLDVRGGSAVDPEPYLARKPKSGCKPRAAGGVDPMGKQGPVAGVACAWAF